jgi:prepilin-type N-terminal cleavage/methylation domain-containing protein
VSRRAGFTLLELMVAITVAGVVALLAFGSASAGLDSSDRLQHARAAAGDAAVMRSMLNDALRHPAEFSRSDETVFALDAANAGDGVPRDRVRFLSRGVMPPLGGSTIWQVMLEPTDDGIRFSAWPVEGNPQGGIRTTIRGMRGVMVRVMSLGEPVWSRQWTNPTVMPAAVEITLVPRAGVVPPAPLVVRTGLEVAP